VALVLLFSFNGAPIRNAHAQDAGKVKVPDIISRNVDRLSKNVVIERPYELGDDLTLVLSGKGAVRLVCRDNPYGLEKVLIGRLDWQGRDILFIYAILGTGEITGGGSELPRIRGACRQVARTASLMTATWRTESDHVDITFSITADKIKNKELLLQFRERDDISRQVADIIALIGEELRLTEMQRVEGFVRLWSEVKYNFVFFDRVPGLDWDSVLARYLPVVQKDQSDYEYYRALQRCLAQLKDGHTNIVGNWPSYVVARPPLEIRPVEGKAIIVSVSSESATPTSAELAPGMEITQVDGRSVNDVLETDFFPYISASTPQWRNCVAYPQLLDGPKDSKVSVQVVGPEGRLRIVTLMRDTEVGSNGPPSAPVEYRQLPEKISYVVINSFESDRVVQEFEKIFDAIRNSDGLIIDVRANTGGNGSYAYAVIAHLTDKPLKGSIWKTRQYMPAFRALGEKEKWYEGACDIVSPFLEGKKPFLGPVVVLVGPGTFSAAEDFLIPLHSSGRATLVGEPTAGSTGQPLVIKLPGRRHARVCTKWDTYSDGREFVGVGVLPDVEVHSTQEDIRKGRDAVLEKGIEVLAKAIRNVNEH
jgi:C-terminal processing protease CtpA/Prc